MKGMKVSAAIGLAVLMAGLLILSYGRSEAAIESDASFQGLLEPGLHVLIDNSAAGFWLTIVADEKFWTDLEKSPVRRGIITEEYPDHIRIQMVAGADTLTPEGAAVLVRIPYRHITAISTFVKPRR